jgi:glycosyltransferase involved in cell wall biosynthesis
LNSKAGRGKVLIVCPIKNEEAGLRKALNSVLSQDYEDFSILVIDNQSQDDSLQIAYTIAAEDSRVVVETSNSSLSVNQSWGVALNKSLQKYDFDYLMFFAGDDCLLNNSYISNSLNGMGGKNQFMGVVPKFIDQFGETVLAMELKGNARRNQYELCKNWAYVHAVYGLYSRECWEKIFTRYPEAFDKSIKFDWWLAINLLSFQVKYSDTSLYFKHRKPIDYGSDYYLAGDNVRAETKRRDSTHKSYLHVLRSIFQDTKEHFSMQPNFTSDNSYFFKMKIFMLFFFTSAFTRIRDRFRRRAISTSKSHN